MKKIALVLLLLSLAMPALARTRLVSPGAVEVMRPSDTGA